MKNLIRLVQVNDKIILIDPSRVKVVEGISPQERQQMPEAQSLVMIDPDGQGVVLAILKNSFSKVIKMIGRKKHLELQSISGRRLSILAEHIEQAMEVTTEEDNRPCTQIRLDLITPHGNPPLTYLVHQPIDAILAAAGMLDDEEDEGEEEQEAASLPESIMDAAEEFPEHVWDHGIDCGCVDCNTGDVIVTEDGNAEKEDPENG